MTEPTNRAQLAGILRVLGRPEHPPLGPNGKRHLLAYVAAAEDTIEAQAHLIASDGAATLARESVRRVQCEVICSLERENDRLKAENATLRKYADAALHAADLALGGARLDGARERIADLRTELEQTT